MPKAKTNRGVVKRVRVTKKGKIKFRHPFTSHLLSVKSGNRRRKLRKRGIASGPEAEKIHTMLRGARP